MKHSLMLIALILSVGLKAQPAASHPCAMDTLYRSFDFWIGDWDVFDLNGQKAGESRIELILDSCIILENWTGAGGNYTGKSFNTYNSYTRQWQQTWVDNSGGTTEFLNGRAEKGKIIFYADAVSDNTGKNFKRRLTFIKIDNNKVRQLGERSDDDGISYTTEYDLEYRRRK